MLGVFYSTPRIFIYVKVKTIINRYNINCMFYFKIDFRPLKLATALSREPGGSWAGSAKKPDIVH